MAESSQPGDHTGGVKVWTFLIRGGQAFRLGLADKIGPPLNHDGQFTLWKMVGTEAEVVAVEGLIVQVIGARVERHTEAEDDEMLAIRHRGEV
jgi:hypothetical protein